MFDGRKILVYLSVSVVLNLHLLYLSVSIDDSCFAVSKIFGSFKLRYL